MHQNIFCGMEKFFPKGRSQNDFNSKQLRKHLLQAPRQQITGSFEAYESVKINRKSRRRRRRNHQFEKSK